ncbi:hypothetical protein FORC13_p144 (plasmid) [Bacillus cereus]|nr:hypothetical protein FORC13_p144 [Bacillus cereus]
MQELQSFYTRTKKEIINDFFFYKNFITSPLYLFPFCKGITSMFFIFSIRDSLYKSQIKPHYQINMSSLSFPIKEYVDYYIYYIL